MYIGDAENPHQLISEIIDNAIDEVQGGYSDKFIVTVDSKQNKYTVRDFGRGIPHGKKTLENGMVKEILEVLCTKSNSGGKFDNKNYSISCGLHGLGMTITNALSEHLNVISYRNGKYVSLTASNGKVLNIDYGSSAEPDGTIVTFIPNPDMFISKVIPIDFIKTKYRKRLNFID